MATLLQIKTAIASYLGKTVADLTVDGQDLGLLAMNQVRQQAEMVHDFEFSRKLVTVAVDGVVGGSLDDAVLYGTEVGVTVKSVIDIGIFDNDGNFRSAGWTTVAGGLDVQRRDNPLTVVPRYPTDSQALASPYGTSKYLLSGANVYRFPKSLNTTDTIGLEVYTFADDWTGILNVTGTLSPDATGTYYQDGVFSQQPFYVRDDGEYIVFYSSVLSKWVLAPPGDDVGLPDWRRTTLEGAYTPTAPATGTATIDYLVPGEVAVPDPLGMSDIWTTRGAQYIQWGAIVQLNNLFKEFVFRQEGNLPPPQALADAGLEALKTWDIFRYERRRRYGR